MNKDSITFLPQTEIAVIFDFDITPNRGDCFSHLGISRELSLIENNKVHLKSCNIKSSNFISSNLVNVNIQDNSGAKYPRNNFSCYGKKEYYMRFVLRKNLIQSF